MKYKRVYFFGTCLTDMLFSKTGLASIRLLKKAGIEEIVFPKGQTCCGQPAYNSGYTDATRKVAQKQIELFSKESIPVIIPSGSCAGMIQEHYPEIFHGTSMYQQAVSLAERCYELTTFLVEECNVQYKDTKEPITITWHSSCHALRESHCIEHSKSLLRQLENVELMELEREYECCGFGGTFSVKMPELSGAMVKNKVEDIQNTKAMRVISGDGACLLNIGTAMEYQNIPIKAQHIADFLWERVYE